MELKVDYRGTQIPKKVKTKLKLELGSTKEFWLHSKEKR